MIRNICIISLGILEIFALILAVNAVFLHKVVFFLFFCMVNSPRNLMV